MKKISSAELRLLTLQINSPDKYYFYRMCREIKLKSINDVNWEDKNYLISHTMTGAI